MDSRYVMTELAVGLAAIDLAHFKQHEAEPLVARAQSVLRKAILAADRGDEGVVITYAAKARDTLGSSNYYGPGSEHITAAFTRLRAGLAGDDPAFEDHADPELIAKIRQWGAEVRGEDPAD